MNKIRLIGRLDIKGPNLIKGVRFEGLRVLGDPEQFAINYYEQGIDELIYIDTVASLYGRNNLLEFVKKVPNNLKIDQKDNQKILIKKVLSNYLPNQLISKKKMGFGLHLNILLKTSLLDWAENLIEFLKQNEDGYIDYNLVKKYWEMFKKNEQISEHFIWNALSYLAWKKNWQNKVYFSDH